MALAATISSIAIHTTFNSIGVWLTITGDDDAQATCALQYKKVGVDADWKDALPLSLAKRGFRTTSTANVGATTISSTTKVPVSITSGTVLTFSNGQTATTTASVSAGATSVAVSALSGSIPSGTWCWIDTSPAIRALYGSIPLRDAGSEYALRIIPSDTNGVTCPASVTTTVNDVAATDSTRSASTATSATIDTASGQVFTRVDSLATPTALLAAVTHYVDQATGNDTTGTGASGAPWATIRKALSSAPAGAVVRVAPGHYTVSGQARATALTLVAQYPAIDDDRAVQNAGNHTIIEYGASTAAGNNTPAVSGPSGTGYTNPWTSTTLVGPNDGISRQVWKWTGSPISSSVAMGYAATRDGLPNRVTHMAASITSTGGSANTPQRWREMLALNAYFHSGFFWPSSPTNDVYLVLPDGSDPNSSYVTLGQGIGIDITGPDVRICGVVMRCFAAAVRISAGARRAIVDHCYFQVCKYGIQINGSAPSTFSRDSVIEMNRFVDTNLWSAGQQATPAGAKDAACISWMIIKGNSLTDGFGSWGRIAANSETAAVYMPGGGWRTVIRNNTIDGPFNGLTAFGSGYDRFHTAETDVAGNTITHISDDAFEPETVAINWRIWGNAVSYSLTGMSTGPVSYGPIYLIHNTFWRTCGDGVGRNDDGNPRGSSIWIKHSFNSHPQAKLYLVNNTVWTDRHYSRPNGLESTPTDVATWAPIWGVDATNPAAGGSVDSEYFYLRNNILRITRKFADNRIAYWDEDYNQLATDDTQGTNNDIRIGSGASFDRATMAGYRSLTGQGTHSNPTGGEMNDIVGTDALLTAPTSADLTLKVGTNALVASGVVVPTIADTSTGGSAPGAYYEHSGANPDLGAIPRGFVAAAPAEGDTTAPVISAIVGTPLANGATITWTTDEASDTQVEYGLTTSYGSTTTLKDTTPFTTAHSDLISSLTASTTYHYRVKSRDAAGNLAVSSDQTFTTLQPTAPGPVGRTPVARTPVSRTPVARVAV